MKKISLHFRGIVFALAKIIKSPLEHLVNILALTAIIATLCSILVINKNINFWQKNTINFPQIVVYFKDNASQNDISSVENSINKFNSRFIKNYQFISKNDGLKEIQQDEALKQIASDVISSNENPLPDVLIVNTNTSESRHLQMLKDKISKLDPVNEVDMDANYANKVSDLISFATKVSHFLQIAFAILLVIITYNIIRLQMLLRKDEIIVSRLIGASDSFIMRPLAYYAVIQVVIATFAAIGIVNLLTRYANNIFLNLGNLFGRGLLLNSLDNMQIAQIVIILVIFAIFSVFLAVRWVFRNSYVV